MDSPRPSGCVNFRFCYRWAQFIYQLDPWHLYALPAREHDPIINRYRDGVGNRCGALPGIQRYSLETGKPSTSLEEFDRFFDVDRAGGRARYTGFNGDANRFISDGIDQRWWRDRIVDYRIFDGLGDGFQG